MRKRPTKRSPLRIGGKIKNPYIHITSLNHSTKYVDSEFHRNCEFDRSHEIARHTVTINSKPTPRFARSIKARGICILRRNCWSKLFVKFPRSPISPHCLELIFFYRRCFQTNVVMFLKPRAKCIITFPADFINCLHCDTLLQSGRKQCFLW